MKTLADLLQEDNAIEGDVYGIGDIRWTYSRSVRGVIVLETDNFGEMIHPSTMRYLPAEGWKRVSSKPTRVEFEGFALFDMMSGKWKIEVDEFGYLEGKRIRVIIEEIQE